MFYFEVCYTYISQTIWTTCQMTTPGTKMLTTGMKDTRQSRVMTGWAASPNSSTFWKTTSRKKTLFWYLVSSFMLFWLHLHFGWKLLFVFSPPNAVRNETQSLIFNMYDSMWYIRSLTPSPARDSCCKSALFFLSLYPLFLPASQDLSLCQLPSSWLSMLSLASIAYTAVKSS